MSGAGTVVFVGPTLRRADVDALAPEATVLPPARQGDVYRAVRTHRPAAVVLIDGAFLDVPSVWHREILWALDQGVAVAGAASMGALRAAELHQFGMRGVGQVFAAYRDGSLTGWEAPFEDDDEVAVIHAPAELGFAPLSDAMVDLRATLARAEDAGMVGRAERDALAGTMKSRHFPGRTLDGLARAATETGHDALAAWLRREHRSLKAADARLALTERPLPAAPFTRQRALVWERFVATQGNHAESPAETAALDRLRQDPASWRAVLLEALGRQAALDAEPDSRAAPDGLSRFRTARELWTRESLNGWMAARGVDAAELERLLHQEAAVDALAREPTPATRAAMLDVLRLRPGPCEIGGA